MKNTVKLLDLSFDLNLINVAEIARKARISKSYAYMIFSGERQNKKAQLQLRNAIVKVYSNVISFNTKKAA